MAYFLKRALTLLMALALLFSLPAATRAEDIEYQNFTIQYKGGQLIVAQGNAAYYVDELPMAPESFALFTLPDDYETLVLTYEKDGQRVFARLPNAGDVVLDGAFPDVIFAAEITDVRLDLETGASVKNLTAAAPLMLEVRGSVGALNLSQDVELTLVGKASSQGTVDLSDIPLDAWAEQLQGNAAGTTTVTVDWTKPVQVQTSAYTVTSAAKPEREAVTKCRICGSTKHTRPTKLSCGHYKCKVKSGDKSHETKLTCGEYECQVKDKDDPIHTQKQPCGHYLCVVKGHEKDHALYACGKHYICGDSKAESHMNCPACGKPLCEGEHAHKTLGCGHAEGLVEGDHSQLPCGKHYACSVTNVKEHALCAACGKGLCEGNHSALSCGLHYACATSDGPGHKACERCGKPLCNGDDHSKCQAPTPKPVETPTPEPEEKPSDEPVETPTPKPESTPSEKPGEPATPSEA